MFLRKLALLIVLVSTGSAYAAFGTKTAWDVQTTGADTNGGAFDSGVGAPGTDESQGAGTSMSCTVQTTTTQAICTPAITATTHGPGNFIGALTGTGCSAAAYNELKSQSAGTGTFDVSLGTAGSVCTTVMGGPMASAMTAANNATAHNMVWVKTGTYTNTAGINFTNGTNGSNTTIEGYGTTHGDWGTAPLFTTSTNSVALWGMAPGTQTSLSWINLSFSSTAVTPGNGISWVSFGGQQWLVQGCKFTGLADGIYTGTSAGNGWLSVLNSTFTGFTNSGVHSATSNPTTVVNSSFNSGTGSGVLLGASGGPTTIVRDLFTNITGSGVSGGSYNSPQVWTISESTFAYNTSNGISIQANTFTATLSFTDNIFYHNGGFGISMNSSAPLVAEDYNAFGSNTSGNYNNINSVNNGHHDVTLTGDPFVNAASGNFALNSSAGASLMNAGFPGTVGLSTGYLDIGAIQHQALGGTVNYGYTH